jgi:hypothetical protein
MSEYKVPNPHKKASNMRTTIIRGSHGSRRTFLRQATGTGAMLGAGLLYHRTAHAADEEEEGENGQPNPIPGGVAPFAPFAIFIHHNPLNPANPLSMLNDPSQITDFNGFVGLTHIRGQGTGTDTKTNAMTTLAYQADMGFSQGEFIGTDGHKHQGTFVFV